MTFFNIFDAPKSKYKEVVFELLTKCTKDNRFIINVLQDKGPIATPLFKIVSNWYYLM